MNLSVINEMFSGYKDIFLDYICLTAVLFSILIIVSKNPIVSVLYLIGLFLCISLYLILLGMNFVGLSYLLVYIGAVSILFIFILMLINVRISELLSATSKSIPLAITLGMYFNLVTGRILPYSIKSNNYGDVNANVGTSDNIVFDYIIDNNQIVLVTSNIWDSNLAETSHITSIGNIMYTSYSIWLILTSVILLLAMVGAIVITLKSRHSQSIDYNN